MTNALLFIFIKNIYECTRLTYILKGPTFEVPYLM